MHAAVETPILAACDTRGPVRIDLVHTAVPGRARLHVEGLKGSPAAKDVLERGGRAAPGVLSVEASTLTGNVLIAFEAEHALQPILDHLTALLQGNVEVAAEPAESGPEWHTLPLKAVCSALETSADEGLASTEASARSQRHGPNALQGIPPRSAATILAGQFQGLPAAMLLGAAVVSVLTGGVLEAAAIVAVIGVNAAIGYQTESRAERTIHSLEAQGPQLAQLVRAGLPASVPVRQIVPGDVLLVQRGDIVPADARLVSAEALTVSESMLTGESASVAKAPGVIGAAGVPLSDRSNMIHRGTIVTGGSGRAIVVATGSRTQAGRIERLVGATTTPETPLQAELRILGRRLGWLTLGVSAVLFSTGLLRGFGVVLMVRSALSVAVAAIPEGLPMVATTALARGIQTLRRQGVHIRKLDAVETFASVEVVCFDKTGTLTLGQISVEAIKIGTITCSADSVASEPPDVRDAVGELLKVCCLCNDTEIVETDDGVHLDGSPTESGLVRAALDSGIDVGALRSVHARLSAQYRTEAYRFMATKHLGEHGTLVAVKGNPEEVLARCSTERLPDGSEQALTPARRAQIVADNLAMAGRALRVLGVASRRDTGGARLGAMLEGLTWLGLVGMADRVRPGVRETIAALHGAGIQTIMLTGDQKATAAAVARDIGLNGHGEFAIVDAADLAGLGREELVRAARRAHAFSRVSPSQKLQIVRSLQEAGVTVAMVGDGVNDGPALKAADVGIAIGRDSMTAAREIADVLIENGDLRGLVAAVETGRTTRANVRKAIRYLVSTNLSEILLVLAGTGIGMGTPLTPMQLLWINIVSDVLPGIGLAMEPPETDVLTAAPGHGEGAVLRREEIGRLASQSFAMAGSAMAAGLFGASRYGLQSSRTQTMMFGSLVTAQLLHAVTSRSRTHGVFNRGTQPPNRALSGILVGSVPLQGALLLSPFVRGVLGLAPLTGWDTITMLIGGTLPFLAMETAKTRGSAPDGTLVWSRESEEAAPPQA